ncbi:MAG: biotin--[acetyl-CoA-carboxylase] ligase [Magnetococcus sp. YQC-5]
MSRYVSPHNPTLLLNMDGISLLNHEIRLDPQDPLTGDSMTPHLTGKLFLPEHYHYHAILDSTNRAAMALAHNGAPEGTLVLADQQTHGRGRYGRVWASPPGLNLYFSMVLRPAMAACHASRMTLMTSLALVETVIAQGITGVRVKWPNDILVQERKLSGILAEMAADGDRVRFVTIGVGLNVNGTSDLYPPEVAGRAVTLAELLQKNVARDEILAEFLLHFERWYRRYHQEGFTPVRHAWLKFARLEGRQVRVVLPADTQQTTLVGEAVEMDENGFLLLKQENGMVSRVMAGDLTHLHPLD